MKKNIYILFAACMLIVMGSCEPKGFDPKDSDGKVLSIAVKEAVFVSNSMQLSFKDNTTLPLTVVTIPAGVAVTYSNKHPEVLDISEPGVLKPVSIGTDTLTITSADGSLHTNFVVNVTDHMVKANSITVAAEGANVQLKIGGADFNLGQYVTLAPDDTWDPRVSYTSNDEAVITITPETGVITPVSVGTTTVTIRTLDGSNLSRDVNVAVLDKAPVDIDRSDWTVETETHNGYGYMWDGGTQAAPVTGKPEHMFDGHTGSYLSLVKPGGSMNSVAPPVGTVPAFIVDMKEAKPFEYIKWSHRNGTYSNDNGSVGTNAYNYLRVYGVYLEGSNDKTTWTAIAPAEPAGADASIVWIPQKVTYVGGVTSTEDKPHTIMVTPSTYRYVRVKLAVQSKNYGTSAGYFQHPTYPGAGSTSGNTMQIAEFGMGVIE